MTFMCHFVFDVVFEFLFSELVFNLQVEVI